MAEQLPLLEDVERWAVVPEAPDYEVSTWGRVRRGRYEVATWANAKGYHLVNLDVAGEPVLRYVHRLVLSAFRGPAAGRLANHLSGHKGENALENLEWTTPAGNMAHARQTGLIPPRPPRTTCAFGHPLDQPYRQRNGRGELRQWKRCARCRRARARARAAQLIGLRSLLALLVE